MLAIFGGYSDKPLHDVLIMDFKTHSIHTVAQCDNGFKTSGNSAVLQRSSETGRIFALATYRSEKKHYYIFLQWNLKEADLQVLEALPYSVF